MFVFIERATYLRVTAIDDIELHRNIIIGKLIGKWSSRRWHGCHSLHNHCYGSHSELRSQRHRPPSRC